MLSHSLWWLICDAIAVYRLAVLVSKDKITDRPRNVLRNIGYTQQGLRASGRGRGAARWMFQLVTCPWCVSLWFAAGVVALTRYGPTGWQYAALALTASGIAGFLAEH